MKMKRRKSGFTLVELVVTLGVFSISMAMAGTVIASLINIQNTTSKISSRISEFSSLNSFCDKYVSFVSINTDDLSFTYSSCSEAQISFKQSSYTYSLSYTSENKSLAITNDYDGDDEYLKYEDSCSLKNLNNVSFSYDTNLNLLIVVAASSAETRSYSYVIGV